MSRWSLCFIVAVLTVAGLISSPAWAQERVWPVAPDLASETIQPTAWSRAVQDVAVVQQVETATIDLEAVKLEDDWRSEQGLPPRFAIPNTVLITPATGGTWEYLDDETLLWRLRITCSGAQSINLGFTQYFMPPGGHLMLYSVDGSEKTRAFTEDDNQDHGQLWTPVVTSDDIVVELTIPQSVLGDLKLELGAINHGYRFFHKTAKDDAGPRAGACEIDVICPDGDPWRNEIPAIGVYTLNGSWTCSGAMVNNTSGDQTPYFLTANHCGVTTGNAGTVVMYWNFYSPTCGAHGGGSLSQNQSGATFKASWSTSSGSDFCLFQLNAAPNPAWQITFAGWDRSDVTSAANPVGIHHPNCDEKSISFTNITAVVTSKLSDTSPGTALFLKLTWQPVATNRGVTEPGSSGSPIFDQNHHILGQLYGGYSACGASDMRDWYGRVFKSWTGGATSTTRLSNWLDAAGTGATSVNTLNPYAGMVVTPTDGLSSSGAAGGPFSPNSKVYTIQNQSSTSINYTVSKTAAWVTLSSTGGTLTAGGSTTVTVSINSSAGSLTVGTYNDTVTFTNTTSHQGDTTRPVTLQVLPALVVTPADGLSSSGPAGGPFSPSSIVYTLQNQSGISINYTVTNTASWVTLSGTGGSLAGGASTNITVSINSTATSLPNGTYNDTVTFTNTTNHQGDTTRSVTLQVGVPTVVYSWNMDTNPNWTISGGQWAWGTPAGSSGDPGSGHTGSNVYGYNLSGRYSNNMPEYYLTTTAINCANLTQVTAKFWRWLGVEDASFDHARFQVSNNGTSWTTVWENPTGSDLIETAWSQQSYDISAIANNQATVYLRWVMGTTNSSTRFCGWNIDDVEIWGLASSPADTTPPTPNPMTFASAPAPAGTTSITMTATTATDVTSPPVSYFFHFVSGGAGGSDSAWQSGTTYTDTGLTANTSYSYQVKARDSASTPNETAYSTPASTTATLIETPTGVSFGTVTANSIVLNAGGTFTNLTTGSSGLYFDSTTTGGDGGINAWVQTTTDTATGLSPNTSYTFQVKARNQSSVETAYSPTAAKVTLANVPTAPTLSGATRTALNLDVNANGNPAATQFAVMCTASSPTDFNWNGKYVNASGGASATAVWRTEAQWGVTTVQALQACTTYTFAVKARNTELVETAFGPGASLGTAGHLGDMDGDGNVDGADIQSFVTCAISGGSGCACANMTISAFVNCLLHPGTCP